MKHITYLTYDGITDPLGQSQILPYLCGLIQNEKFKITLVSFEKSENYNENKTSILSITNHNNIEWIRIKDSNY